MSLKKGEKHIPIDEEWSGYDEWMPIGLISLLHVLNGFNGKLL